MPSTKKPDVSLDLDRLERKDPPKPFTINLAGQMYTLTDPQELPWQVISNLRTDSSEFLGIAVGEGQRGAFNDGVNELPAWKVRELVNTYMEHHGMPTVGESLALPAS